MMIEVTQTETLEPNDYTFYTSAKKVEMCKSKGMVQVCLLGIDQDTFNSKEVIKRIDIDLIIETIGAEKLLNRILGLPVKAN